MAVPRFTTLFACVLLLAASFSGAAASSETSEHVHVLGADFDDNVNDGSVWFIKVRCRGAAGHCKGRLDQQLTLLCTSLHPSCAPAVLCSMVR